MTAQPTNAATKTPDKKTPPPAAAAKPPTPDPKTDTAGAASATTTAATGASDATDDEAVPKERQKVYIVVGEVREFKNSSEAEKYLNKDPAAPKDNYVVIKGKKVERKAKVSLR